METPAQWPREISESYDPIRKLGTGGFASVVLARPKNQQKDHDGVNILFPKRVAIKVVGGDGESTENVAAASLYARREIEILNQIRHCGIAQLLDSWEHDTNNRKHHQSPTAGVLVLEYVKGPTVECLLKHGGALSNTFARVVIAQVMDAVSYLHYRAVVHRDIKPDNIIVTGAVSSDDSIWDNDHDGKTAFNRDDSKSPEEWRQLCYKYRAKIIDFGFARALTPGDVEDGSSHPFNRNAAYSDVQDTQINDSQRKKNGKNGKDSFPKLLDISAHSVASVSHKMKRVMSTLGNRNYAAPEIVNRVRRISPQDKRKERQKDLTQKSVSQSTKTISAFVADYGLLVDSYSMGHTIRYMMTGVQPGASVEDAIMNQKRSRMVKKLLSKIGLRKKEKESENKTRRKPRYRLMDDIPGQAFLLIEQLTEISPHKRISIRNARRKTDWISQVLSFQTQPSVDGGTPSSNENALPCQLLSLDYCSEEQLQSLDETRYLPMATTTPESVVSIRGRTNRSGTLDTIHTLDCSDNGNPVEVVEDHDDAIGLCLEDEMITF